MTPGSPAGSPVVSPSGSTPSNALVDTCVGSSRTGGAGSPAQREATCPAATFVASCTWSTVARPSRRGSATWYSRPDGCRPRPGWSTRMTAARRRSIAESIGLLSRSSSRPPMASSTLARTSIHRLAVTITWMPYPSPLDAMSAIVASSISKRSQSAAQPSITRKTSPPHSAGSSPAARSRRNVATESMPRSRNNVSRSVSKLST